MKMLISRTLSTVWSMNLSHLFIEIYLFMHISLIPIFISEFHLSLFQVSFIATIPTLVGLLVSLFSGLLIDRIGAKPILVIGMVLQAFGGLIVAECYDIISLFLGVTLISTASPLYHNAGLATISRVLSNGKLSRAMGLHNAMGSLGASMGLLSLPLILVNRGWRFAYLIWVGPVLIWTLLLLKVKISSDMIKRNNSDGSSKKSIFTSSYIHFLFSMSLCQMGFVAVMTFITSYMVLERGLSEATASLIFAVGPLIGILSSLSAGHFSGRMGDRRFLILIMIASAITMLVIPFAPTIAILAISYFMFTFFGHSIWPPITSITASLTPLNRRGVAYSLSMASYQIVYASTPPLIAKVIELTSIQVMFPISCFLVLAGVAFLRFFVRCQ